MLRALAVFVLLASPALAEITVTDARLVAAFPNAKAGAFYATVESDASDLLIGAHTPDAMSMLHETVDDNGVMRMESVEQVAVQDGEPLAMEPGGLHVMVMGLTPEMLEAETLSVKLIFKDAGEVAVDAPIHIGIDAANDHAGGDHGEGKTE